MAGLNNIREAYEQVYAQMNEALDPEEMALRRELARDKKASKMAPSVATKYAGSEAQSARREDQRSRGRHIHGMADSYELEGDVVDEKHVKVMDSKGPDHRASNLGRVPKRRKPIPPKYKYSEGDFSPHDLSPGARRRRDERRQGVGGFSEARIDRPTKDDLEAVKGMPLSHKARMSANQKAIEDMKKTKAYADMVKAARKHFDEETISERELDPTETKEKERLVKGLKKSAKDFKARYGKRWKNVMYATATTQAQRSMDTAHSDRRYGVEP
jgi:hypothetical protein